MSNSDLKRGGESGILVGGIGGLGRKEGWNFGVKGGVGRGGAG